MKKLVLFLLAISAFIFTQAQVMGDDELAMIKDFLKTEKRDIVKEYMKLDEAQSAKFWPMYDEFQEKRRGLAQERLQIIKDYGASFATLTDDQATSIVKRIFKNDNSYSKLQQSYFKKFSKSISPIKAAQFLQLEEYFRTMIRAEIQDAIPFIGEIERKKG